MRIYLDDGVALDDMKELEYTEDLQIEQKSESALLNKELKRVSKV